MPLFIVMRCLQACGSSAVVAVGAGSLADMFEVHERGQKLGVFYGMPLIGPAIGPLIGGALGNVSYGCHTMARCRVNAEPIRRLGGAQLSTF